MKCRQANNLLSPYMDGELHGKQKAALEEHLASCEACRDELEDLRAISETIRDIFRRIEPPPDLLEKTMRRIREMEAGGEIERLRRSERAATLRRVAVGVGLAAGIGLAALQVGRAGVGLGPGPQLVGPAAPRVAVTAEGTRASPEGETQVPVNPQEDTAGKVDATKAAPAAPQGKTARPEAAKEEIRVTVAPKGSAAEDGASAALAVEGPAGPVGSAQFASVAGPPSPDKRVFLSNGRRVRTTMVKLEVADLQAARLAVAAAAIGSGAASVEEAWNYRQEQVILRVLLPVASANRFVVELSRLGEVLGQSTETADVTAEFKRRLAEYQELSARADPQSQAVARAAEKVLEALDRESLEAGREVVNVWLVLR